MSALTVNDTDARTLELLAGVLDECEHCFNALYLVLHPDDGDIVTTTRELESMVCNLRRKIMAADALAVTIANTSTGWPADDYDLATFDGARSGYPVDLLNSMLCKAEALTNVMVLALRKDCPPTVQCDKAPPTWVTSGTLNGALWGVHGFVHQAAQVIRYQPPADKSTAEAA